MAVTTNRSVDNGTVTYTIVVTTEQARGDAVAEKAARYVYPVRYQEYDGNGDPIPFDSLTNPQKIAILGREAKNHLVNCAKAYHINTAIDTAHDTAEGEAEDLEIED
jgi:hypothetical protein